MNSPRTMMGAMAGLIILFAAVGCDNGSKSAGAPAPTTTTPPMPPFMRTPDQQVVKEGLEPREADLPELPKGAGAIDDDAPKELTPTKTGLYYRILRKSDGRKPTIGDVVVADYKGWLDSGKEFDSSYERGEPAKVNVVQLIPGFREGIQLIGEGGMIELEVSPDLGYGDVGPPEVAPNSTLHYIIELKEVLTPADKPDSEDEEKEKEKEKDGQSP